MYGCNINVIISASKITYFDINETLIGCDGVCKKMKNKMNIDKMWKLIRENEFKMS